MSAITSDWSPAETSAPITGPVECDKVARREEEFRSALASYIAGYIAEQQKRRAPETVSRNGDFNGVLRFVGWMRGR
jgi:hypothetical protein